MEEEKTNKNPEEKQENQEQDNMAELENKLKYLQADFENYRKFSERQKAQWLEFANEGLIKELLIVLDEMESALGNSKDEGIEMIYKKLKKILESKGLREIESLGKKADPFYHDVIAVESSEKPKDEIVDVIQKGYMLNLKVIRYAKVKVSNGGELNGN